MVAAYRLGEFDITFNCKPQLWLKIGELKQEFTAAGTIYNPTLQNAHPWIRAYGTGKIAVGTGIMTINSADIYTDIDCDIEEIYKETTNCNSNVTMGTAGFPELVPGDNEVSFSDGITKLEIIPRWFVI